MGHAFCKAATCEGRKLLHPKLPHLARPLQAAKRLGNLLRTHQVVGMMQLIQIDLLHAQPLQGALAPGRYAPPKHRSGTVPPHRSRRAGGARRTCWPRYLAAHPGNFPEHRAENALRPPSAVNVGMIEQGVPGFVGGDHRRRPRARHSALSSAPAIRQQPYASRLLRSELLPKETSCMFYCPRLSCPPCCVLPLDASPARYRRTACGFAPFNAVRRISSQAIR